MSSYVEDGDLPQPEIYLRTKYPDLPASAVAEATSYLTDLMREHGVADPAGPKPGEDEH